MTLMHVYPVLNAIGRVLFGLYFAYNGYSHLRHAGDLAGYAASKKVPYPKAAVYASGVIALLGGLGLIFDLHHTISLVLILIFLVPVTIFMHDFWTETDPMSRVNSRISFLKNTALIAAVLALL